MEQIGIFCLLVGCIFSAELKSREMVRGESKFTNLRDCKLNNNFNFTSETYLRINGSCRGQLSKELFKNLKNLNYLIIENLNISQIVDITQNNNTLQMIRLTDNYLTIIPDNVFKNNNRLRYLTITKNHIRVLNGETFNGLSNIIFLDLSFNKISIVHEKAFYVMHSLKVLKLNNNKIVQFPKNIFKYQKNLNFLDLSENRILKLENSIFEPLSELETFYIRNNHIIHLDNNIFLSLSRLKIFEISGNNISTIKDIFESLVNLEELDLSSNNLTYISSELKNCKHLRKLNLSNNFITNLSKNFLNMTFQNLDITDNTVETIELDFTMITRDLKINLSNNKRNISEINVAVEQKLHYNLTLLLYGSTIICDGNIKFFKIIHNIFIPDDRDKTKVQCYDSYSKRYIGINEVNIQEIVQTFKCHTVNSANQCECYKRQFDNTRIVDCSFRNLTEFPNLAKVYTDPNRPVGESIILNMTGNLLQHVDKVPPDYNNVTRIINLKLFLSNNKIETFTWIPQSNLRVLTLNDNQLKYLNEDVLESFKNITFLTLNNNPWSCECLLVSPLWRFMKEQKKANVTESLQCDNPNDLNNEPFCNDYMIMKIGLPLSFLLILLIVTISLVIHNITLVKAWLYHRRWFLWLVKEEDLDKNKVFDVFICYAHQEDDFINSNLLPWLDSLPTMKICIHIRNFIPGENILEQSIWSIRNSRRTLVVLSNSFLNSGWCVEEFNVAYNWSIEDKRKRLIAIKYGPLNEQNMSETIKTYIKTTTYLEWGSYGFWNKLEYALPHYEQ